MGYAMPMLLVLLLAEVLASAAWWPVYFRHGLLLYHDSIPLSRESTSIPSVEELTVAFRGRFGPSLAFREVGTSEVAFREAFFELRLLTYTPVMHGLVRVESLTRRVELEGRANWFSLAFAVFAFVFVWSTPDAWPILILLAVLLGGVYKVQVALFRRVGDFVAA